MATEFGPTLGVSTADFNGDGWIDIYVANDGQPNQLWINQHNGTFKNTALLSGTAIGDEGKAKSSMGVDAGDFDNDGDEDLLVTTLTGQGSDLYVNDGAGVFEEQSARTGIRAPSLPLTGFGVGWLDFDNDGWLDVLTVNGTVTRDPQRPAGTVLAATAEAAAPQSREAGASKMSRAGPAPCFNCPKWAGAPPSATSTTTATPTSSWRTMQARCVCSSTTSATAIIGLDCDSRARPFPAPPRATGRDMLGARVGITRRDGSTLWRRARSDGSYASANDPRVLVGLGSSAERRHGQGAVAERPDRGVRECGRDRYTTLTEGAGR